MKLCCIVNGKKYCICGWSLCKDHYNKLAPVVSKKGAIALNNSHKEFSDTKGVACSATISASEEHFLYDLSNGHYFYE